MDPIHVQHVKKTTASILSSVQAFQRGTFTLSSGQTSDTYVNCRRATLDGTTLHQLTRLLSNLIEEKAAPVPLYIGGPTSAADPIVTSLISVYRAKGYFVRKEAKAHGTKDQIEGHPPEGADTIIVDDVATSGASLKLVIDALTPIKAKVKAAFVIVDREEGARSLLNSLGVPLYSLITLTDLKRILP